MTTRAGGAVAAVKPASATNLVIRLTRATVSGDQARRRRLARQLEDLGWGVVVDERRLRRFFGAAGEGLEAYLRGLRRYVERAERAAEAGRIGEAAEASWMAARAGVAATPPPWLGQSVDLATWIRDGSSPDGG